MLSNFNLEQLLTFPFKETEARKNFLIGTLVYFASFIIPILPLIFVMGYIARIMRQIFNGEEPHMPAWDDWESMFKDGVYLFGVRIIYMLPIFALMLPFFFGFIFLIASLESNNNASGQIAALIFPLMGIFMLAFIPISLALSLLVPAAEAHTIAHSDFAACFHIREWWAIFRANWGSFVIAYLISMVASFVLTFIVQIAIATLILICVLPFVMPAISMYITTVMYAAFAQAYKDGKDRIAQNSHATT
jgi:hypothetical protein